jgi:exosortase family protein XrtF
MSKGSFQEFKPTIYFLGKFIALYLIGNLLYGLYVTDFSPKPDPVTRSVTVQTGFILTQCGWPMNVRDHESKPNAVLLYNSEPALNVYEGCNGINTIIIFVAFLVAFGPASKSLLWFLPLGVFIIHLMNLLRITLLFFVAEYRPDFMYFIHKYVFTGVLYAAIFLLWILWVKKFATDQK